MKKVFIACSILSLFMMACSSDKSKGNEEETSNKTTISPDEVEFETNDEGNATSEFPEIQFESETIDIGDVVDGEKKVFSFRFTNTGKANLIIKSAQGSCGCTVPSPPKEPIAPGESSSISVVFDSAGKGPGPDATGGSENIKNITVWTNCKEAQKVIKFRANVLPQ